MCVSFAVFAFALTPTLFAISASLALRSNPTPSQEALGKAAHLIAFACVVMAPNIWAAISDKYWRWSAFFAIGSALLFKLAWKFLPDAPHMVDLGRSITTLFFPVTFALMIAAGILGIGMRSSYRQNKRGAFWLQALCYLAVAIGAFFYLGIPLFVE
jgi:hypothetical protein